MNYIVLQHHYLLIRGIAIVHPRCSNPTIDFLIFNKRIAYFHTTENYLREKREKKKQQKSFSSVIKIIAPISIIANLRPRAVIQKYI